MNHLGSLRGVSPDDVIRISHAYEYGIKRYRVFYIECFDGSMTEGFLFSDLFSHGWDFAYNGILVDEVIIN